MPDLAASYVSNIVDGTKRMRDLLSDLLAYNELGALMEKPPEAIDLNIVLEKALHNLNTAINDSGAIVTAGQLPTVHVHEGHFVSVFQNLIGNAIKYHSEQSPRIRIAVQQTDGQLCFSVADNGLGIAPEYHQKIFGAFKRLHGKQIPGTGIGLAICQRVIERYGGRIWVESQAGQGATFLFTLPVSSQTHKGAWNA